MAAFDQSFDSTVYARVTDSIFVHYTQALPHFVPDSIQDFHSLMQSQGLQEFEKLLAEIYENGIIDVQKPYKTLIVERAPLSQRISLKVVRTLPEAHGDLMLKIPSHFDSTRRVKFKEIIYQSLVPNTIYNDELSSKQKAQVLASVS